MAPSTPQFRESAGPGEIPSDLGSSAVEKEVPKTRDAKVTEARLVGLFAWAELMLEKAAILVDRGDLEEYIQCRNEVEDTLHELANEMGLPANQAPDQEAVSKRWVKEDEKIAEIMGKLEGRARNLAVAQGKPKERLLRPDKRHMPDA